jgi:hypothetical protein
MTDTIISMLELGRWWEEGGRRRRRGGECKYHGAHGRGLSWGRRRSACGLFGCVGQSKSEQRGLVAYGWSCVGRSVVVPGGGYSAGDGQRSRNEELEELHFAEEVRVKLFE